MTPSDAFDVVVIKTNRMAEAFRDIIDLCNTDPCTWRADTTDADWMKLLAKIVEAFIFAAFGQQSS